MSTIPEILDALKTRLETTGVDVYHYVPDSPVLPSLCVYPESWPYAFNEDKTIIVLCLAGTTDTEGAQTQMLRWVSDEGDESIVAAIDDDNTLNGTVSSVLPLQLRNWGVVLDASGKRLLQAELVLNILR